MSLNRKYFALAGMAVLVLGFDQAAKADSVTFTASGTNSGDSVAGSVTFTAQNGSILIAVTNTETGTFDKGQAISGLDFSVANGLNTPTDFTEMKGLSFDPTSGGSWTAASGTSFDTTSNSPPVNAINHWGFKPSGSNVILQTATSPVPGSGNPHYMILPASGTAGGGSSLANSNFYPFVIGTTDFTLTVPSITTSTVLSGDITSVTIDFGTGPDVDEPGTQTTVPAPLPSTIAEASLLLGFVAIYGLKRKRALATVRAGL